MLEEHAPDPPVEGSCLLSLSGLATAFSQMHFDKSMVLRLAITRQWLNAGERCGSVLSLESTFGVCMNKECLSFHYNISCSNTLISTLPASSLSISVLPASFHISCSSAWISSPPGKLIKNLGAMSSSSHLIGSMDVADVVVIALYFAGTIAVGAWVSFFFFLINKINVTHRNLSSNALSACSQYAGQERNYLDTSWQQGQSPGGLWVLPSTPILWVLNMFSSLRRLVEGDCRN